MPRRLTHAEKEDRAAERKALRERARLEREASIAKFEEDQRLRSTPYVIPPKPVLLEAMNPPVTIPGVRSQHRRRRVA